MRGCVRLSVVYNPSGIPWGMLLRALTGPLATFTPTTYVHAFHLRQQVAANPEIALSLLFRAMFRINSRLAAGPRGPGGLQGPQELLKHGCGAVSGARTPPRAPRARAAFPPARRNRCATRRTPSEPHPGPPRRAPLRPPAARAPSPCARSRSHHASSRRGRGPAPAAAARTQASSRRPRQAPDRTRRSARHSTPPGRRWRRTPRRPRRRLRALMSR
jgi:hypothetical protein